MSTENIVANIKSLQPFVRTSLVIYTLTYLYHGGRYSGAAAIAGNTLKVHPSISVTNVEIHLGKNIVERWIR